MNYIVFIGTLYNVNIYYNQNANDYKYKYFNDIECGVKSTPDGKKHFVVGKYNNIVDYEEYIYKHKIINRRFKLKHK